MTRADRLRLAALAAAACAVGGLAGGEQQVAQLPKSGVELPGPKETEVLLDSKHRAKTAGPTWSRYELGGREYLLEFPQDYGYHPHNRSLLILLHGFGVSADHIAKDFESLLYVPDGPVILAPYGEQEWGLPRSWNTHASQRSRGPDGPTCAGNSRLLGCGNELCRGKRKCRPCMLWYDCSPKCVWSTCVNDFQFIDALLDEVQGGYSIDPQKVFMSGFSMGGSFAWDVAGHWKLAKRFTAVAPLHGSPQAGFAVKPPAPTDGPWLMGLWGGKSKASMDNKMPPWSNIPGRPDKSHTIQVEGQWFYNTAQNATTTYAAGMKCPERGVDLVALLGLPNLRETECWDDGCSGSVIRCVWNTHYHETPAFGPELVWRFFTMAWQARYGQT